MRAGVGGVGEGVDLTVSVGAAVRGDDAGARASPAAQTLGGGSPGAGGTRGRGINAQGL